MSKPIVTKPTPDFSCDFCGNPDTIASINGPDPPNLDICRSCAMDLVYKLKTKITNDLLGIKDA